MSWQAIMLLLALPWPFLFFTRINFGRALKQQNSLKIFIDAEQLSRSREISAMLIGLFLLSFVGNLTDLEGLDRETLANHPDVDYIINYFFFLGIVVIVNHIMCYRSLEKKEIQSNSNFVPKSSLQRAFHFFGYHLAFFVVFALGAIFWDKK